MTTILSQLTDVLLNVEFYIMLPVFMLVIALITGQNFQRSLKASITLGVGFIGIFIVFDHFVLQLGPVLEALVLRTGVQMDVFDVGWPPMARIAWSYRFVPVLLIVIIVINLIAFKLNMCKTLNIDIWNFWHFIFLGQMVHVATDSLIWMFGVVMISELIVLLVADYSVRDVHAFTGVEGISITTLACVCYYPFAVFMNGLLDKWPFIKNLKADPKSLEKRLGFLGDPIAIGFLLGCGLGVSAGYHMMETIGLAFNIAAVVFILPRVTQIINESIIPISEGVKARLSLKYGHEKTANIGIHFALLMGDASVVVTGILMMPIVLIMSMTLPSIRFLPIASLPNLISIVPMVVVACNRHILKAVIISSLIMVGNFYVASGLSDFITTLGRQTGYNVPGYDGLYTSFLEGGNLLRYWLLELSQLSWIGLLGLPVAVCLLLYTRQKRYV